VWLKGEDGWLDYRSITPWGGRQSADVEVELPDDPIADISAPATQGESTHLEYKSTLPGEGSDTKRKALKTVVAFANGEGGVMLFGVEGDDDVGQIVGIGGQLAANVRRLNDLVRDRISPNPSFRITGHTVDQKCVIRLDVVPGQGTLHALVIDPNKPEYYVRRNGSTYYARPEELAQIVASHSQQPFDGIRRLL
jgi:predicted HTH transcriptional regulator